MGAGLTERERHVVAVSALTVAGDRAALEQELAEARDSGIDARELREALLLSALFGGFPRAVHAV
jgi:alkylhydroperoxidase/carboxymuconolactone decarboxylase family protein YurZ